MAHMLQKIVLVVTGVDSGETLERWSFDIEADKEVTEDGCARCRPSLGDAMLCYAMLCYARRCYTSCQQPRCMRTVLAQEAAPISTPLLFPLALAGRVYCTFDGHHPCVPVRTCVRVCVC